MEEKIITFSGNNQKLFSRVLIDNFDAKTTLIVPETHNAIFIKDGQMLQTLSSGRYFISQFVDLRNEQNSKLEILFMSKTAKLKLLWGTPSKILMFDSVLQENYNLGLSGDFEVQISDPRRCYLYLVGAAEDLTSDALQERLMSNVISVLENTLVEHVANNKVLYSQISLHKKKISQVTLQKLSKKLNNEYGIAVFSFNIANIIIDSEDLNRLTSLQANKSLVCRKCGVELSAEDKFCSSCGCKVGGGIFCSSCQMENVDGAKFCSNCGKNLN